MKSVNVVKTAAWLALLAGIAAAQLKYVAVVETGIDERSGAAAEITSAEVALMTAELRREAVKNLPRDKYSVMTSETVQSMGGAVLEECAEENCVVTLGAKIGADYIVRGTVSKFQAKFTLSVEMYETDNGTLVASSEAARSQNLEELLDKATAACAEMFKTFAAARNSARKTPSTHTIAVNANPANGGATSRYPDQTYYEPGTNVYVAATPADGYKFAGWSGDAADTANPATVTMDGDKTLTANFQYAQRMYALTTNASPQDGGAVARNPDKEAYTAGEKVTVTAVSADGYKFIDWTGAVTSRKNRATVTMDGDKALTANFYRKSVTAGAPGDTASNILVWYDNDGKPVYYTAWSWSAWSWTEEDYRADSAKNVFMVDAVPFGASMGIWGALALGVDGEFYGGSFFGLGLQYERRLYRKFSLVGRYDYFGVWDLSYPSHDDWSSHLHSFETHARYYPTGRTFFLDGMLGYYVNTISVDDYEYYSSGTYDYFKWGASLGWRIIRPRKENGLTYEISFGWNFAINNTHYRIENRDAGWLDAIGTSFDTFGAWLGGSGPRAVFAFGWRF